MTIDQEIISEGLATVESQLIRSIYESAITPQRWHETLVILAMYCSSDQALLSMSDKQNPYYNAQHYHSFPCNWHLEASKMIPHDFEQQSLSKAWFNQLDIGIPSSSDAFFGSEAAFLEVGGIYVEYLFKNGIRHKITVILERNAERLTRLSLTSAKPFPNQSLTLLSKIVPYLLHALYLHRQTHHSNSHENCHLYGMLDTFPDGIILLNTASKINYINSRALKILQQHDGLSISHDSLITKNPENHSQLQNLLLEALFANKNANNSLKNNALTVLDSSNKIKLLLTVHALKQLPQLHILANDSIAIVLILQCLDRTYEISRRQLYDHFGLTQREVDICQRFINSPELTELCAQTGLAMNSLRSIMKSIFEKTGKHSQTELMRLLMGLQKYNDII